MSATRSDRGGAPLENRTLREQVADHLRLEILEGRLAPGAELGETMLAASLNVSRGPLREALGQLAAEKLVTIVPRRGAIVRRLTRQEFLDAYQVREALESLAVRLAVPRLSDGERAALHALCDEMDAAARRSDSGAFIEINHDFHQQLVRASGNETLIEMHAQLLGQMGRLLKQSVQLRGGVERSSAEHREILAAIDKGDAAEAARLLEEHIEIPQRVLRSNAAVALFDSEQPEPMRNETPRMAE
jgi:DNA-binding GntR family transcriptional regulator